MILSSVESPLVIPAANLWGLGHGFPLELVLECFCRVIRGNDKKSIRFFRFLSYVNKLVGKNLFGKFCHGW
jgi:hypothetical protein